LAAQLGSNLRGVCYILDEPTIGLHPRDNQRLLAALGEMRDRGNTILVVEHDEETIRRGDHIIDLGPGGGAHGGRVVASGTLAEIQRSPESITGAYLNGGNRKEITSRLGPRGQGTQFKRHQYRHSPGHLHLYHRGLGVGEIDAIEGDHLPRPEKAPV